MKKFYPLIIAGAASIACILILIFITRQLSASLEITVIDAGSKSWVFDSTIRVQDRVIRGFKSLSYTFKDIKTGRHKVSVSAPDYESKEIEVDIHGGRNAVKTPVELHGYAIPGLASISIFENVEEENIALDIRLVNAEGEAISDHPCLPLRILMRISPQIVNKQYRLYEQGMKLERGTPFFAGEAEIKWNTDMTETYRYSGFVSLDNITGTDAPYLIIDYLFLIPNPMMMTGEETEAVVREIGKIEDPEELKTYLNAMNDRMTYFISIKTDVENFFGGTL